MALHVRQIVQPISARVHSGGDLVTYMKLFEIGIVFNRILHGHGFHETGDGFRIDSGGLIFGIQCENPAGELIVLLSLSRFRLASAGGKDEKGNNEDLS